MSKTNSNIDIDDIDEWTLISIKPYVSFVIFYVDLDIFRLHLFHVYLVKKRLMYLCIDIVYIYIDIVDIHIDIVDIHIDDIVSQFLDSTHFMYIWSRRDLCVNIVDIDIDIVDSQFLESAYFMYIWLRRD